MAEENKLKSKTYIPKVYYNGTLLSYKETPLTVNEVELCKYCKEEFTVAQIKHIEPSVNIALAEKLVVFLNDYRADFKLDTCLRKAHFISQCLLESDKFSKLKESMAYSPSSIKKYYKETEYIKLTDANIETYKDKFKILDTRTEADKKKDKDVKDKYAEFEKLNPAYLYGNTRKKKYQETIYLNTEKTLAVKILSHTHDEKEVANRKYSNRTDLGHNGGDDGFSFFGRGIIQITGKNNYSIFTEFRKKNPFPGDTSGAIDFALAENSVKLEDKNDPIYVVQSALWFWLIGNTKVYLKSDTDSIEGVTRKVNGGTNHIKERNQYIQKAREEESFQVYNHYKETHKNGSKEKKDEVLEMLKSISEDNLVYDSHHKKKVNLKDDKAGELLKELRKEVPLTITPKGIATVPFEITTDLKLKPVK